MQGDHDGVDQSDVGNCSSDAGMEAFLREAAEHGQVDYFQGIHSTESCVEQQFREQGATSLTTTPVSRGLQAEAPS